MTERDEALSRLRARLDWVRETDDRAQIMRPEAELEAARLATAVEWTEDTEACAALGWYHWLRATILAQRSQQQAAQSDFGIALQLFALVVRVDPAAVPEQVARAYRQSREDSAWEPNSASSWNTQAIYLMRSYEKTGQLKSLLRGGDLQRQSVQATPESVASRAERLSNLGAMLRLLADAGMGTDTLVEAVQVGRAASTATPPGSVAYGPARRNLANALADMFVATGEPELIEEAVVRAREAVAVCAPDEPERPGRLDTLVSVLVDFGRHTGDESVLREAVRHGAEAVRIARSDHPDRARLLANLGRAREEVFSATGEVDQLREAAAQLSEAVRLTPESSPYRARRLIEASKVTRELAEATGDLTSIRQAVDLARQNVANRPEPRLDSARTALSALGAALQTMFEVTDDLSALEEAIDVTRRALRAGGAKESALDWSNLGNALRLRFVTTGDHEALTEAIEAARRARAVPGIHDTDRAMYLSNLGLTLTAAAGRTRFDELQEAVEVLREATRLGQPSAADRALYLRNLATALGDLFDRVGEVALLDEALACSRTAASLSSATRAGFAIRVTLIRSLLRRYAAAPKPPAGTDQADREGPGLLDEAQERAQELLELSGDDAFSRTEAVHLHINVLAAQFGRTNDAEHLRKALQLVLGYPGGIEAAELSEPRSQMNLGQLFRLLYHSGLDPEHLRAARACYRRAAQFEAQSAAQRFAAYRAWAELPAAEDTPADEGLEAVEGAVALVPRLVNGELDHTDRIHAAAQLFGLPALAASAALTAGRAQRAVELLEATRGLLTAAAFDLEDLAARRLRDRAPALADDFDVLRSHIADLERRSAAAALDRPQTRVASHRDSLAAERRTAYLQWEALLQRIKTVPGLAGFPAILDATELTREATEGPIVYVTADRRRCDALVLTGDPAQPVIAVELPSAGGGEAIQQTGKLIASLESIGESTTGLRAQRRAQQDITEILAWVWDAITEPVLAVVDREVFARRRTRTADDRDQSGPAGHTTASAPEFLPRLWWCPVGRLTFLPLHAAGRQTATDNVADGLSVRPEAGSVADRVVSSYTPTVRALNRARAAAGPDVPARGTIAVVAEPGGGSIPVLSGAAAEARAVADTVPGAVLLEHPDHDAALAALAEYPAVHFACHGLTDLLSPESSSLVLHDFATDPLTLAEIRALHLPQAQLAYLSACATALTGPALTDEGLHLTASFQLAGFRHVIGTLWPMRDTAAMEITRGFYAVLTAGGTAEPDPSGAARALHRATVALRDRYAAQSPTLWAAHIHVGP